MGRYWKTSMQYSQISVGELQRKAQQSVNNAKSKGKEMHPSYFKLPLLIVPEELTFLIITFCCFLEFYITMENMV